MMTYDVKQLRKIIYKAHKSIPPENSINIGELHEALGSINTNMKQCEI